MTEAIFGLVGVLVGGVLNGAVAQWQARRAESHEVRAAARLLLDELLEGWSVVELVTDSQVWRSESVPSTERWTEHEALFARAMSFEDWASLRTAVREMRKWAACAPLHEHRDRTAEEIELDQGAFVQGMQTLRASGNALRVVTRLATWGTRRPSLRIRVLRARGQRRQERRRV